MAESEKSSLDSGRSPSNQDQGTSETVGMDRAEVGRTGTEQEQEHLLVEQGSAAGLPAHLRLLLAAVRRDSPEPAAAMDLLVGFLYVLVVETGFTPLQSQDAFTPSNDLTASNLRVISQMPAGWRHPERAERGGALYELHFQLAAFPEHPCRLVGVPSGDLLIVNAVASDVPDGGAAFSHSFRATDFISDLEVCDLQVLAFSFKDLVIGPVKAAIYNSRKLRNASFLGLPNELQLRISSLLPARDLNSLGRTCRCMADLLGDQCLWKLLCRRRFHADYLKLVERDNTASSDSVDWLQEFRRLHTSSPPSMRLRRLHGYSGPMFLKHSLLF